MAGFGALSFPPVARGLNQVKKDVRSVARFWPFRAFGQAARRAMLPSAVVLPKSPPVQSSWPDEVPPAWVGRSRCTVGHFPGLAVFPRRTAPGVVKASGADLSSGLASSRSIAQQGLADSPAEQGKPNSDARSGFSHGLSLPTAHQGLKVHFTRALPARYVPPSGFGYPLDGLLPSSPRRFCFAPAALLGLSLRSFLLPTGVRGITAPEGPTYRFSLRENVPPKRHAGSKSRGFWASALTGIPRGRRRG